MLDGCRVLDLTDHRGQLAGAVLASLGADVVAVEAPGGSPARSAWPSGPNGTSLTWWSYARGKRSAVVTADLDDERFRRLVAAADVLLESGPGGFDPDALALVNPALVHVTISPFGCAGPKAHWPASDLTILAAGCSLALTGDADRAPVRTTVPQAWLHAGAEAACGALLALHERARSGRGQHVDVSAQVAAMMAAVPATVYGPNGDPDVQRLGGGLRAGTWELQFVYPAADGFVSIMHAFGDTVGPYTARLMELAYERGACDEAMRDVDWVHYGTRLVTGEVSGAHLAAAKAAIATLTASCTKAELVAEAARRPLLLAPVVTVPELLHSEQLAARDYWDDVEDPDLGTVRAPGRFARFGAAPLAPLGPPPRLGEHTEAVLAGWARPAPEPPAPASPAVSGRPLDGLKVLDFTWVYAGPLATRLLADFGATVVKVECARRPDTTRGAGPFLEGDLGPDGSGQYAHFNAGKLGMGLDLGVPEARAVAEDLVRWADVVIDAYTPGVMDAWGLGPERLLELNPQVIALSTCLMGRTGPLARFSGFGNLAGAVTGFYELTGWPDRPPAGPFLAYTDYVSPRYLVAAILAALAWRRTHGRGQAIDLSQAECALHFLAPAVADWVVNGRAAGRRGNADPWFAPHGVYPCAGDDRWVAVVCETEAQWRGLCGAIGQEAQLGELVDCDRAARLARSAELDERLAAWTAARPASEVEDRLVAAGVPVHEVINSTAAAADPQLRALGHFVTIAHPVHGSCIVEAPRVNLSRTPGRVVRAGPRLGEHSDEVLRGLLGYDDDRIAALAVSGALD